MTKTKLKRVKSNDKDFDRLGGFVNWNKKSEDVGHKAKRQFHVKKEQRTSVHQLATESVAFLKKMRGCRET